MFVLKSIFRALRLSPLARRARSLAHEIREDLRLFKTIEIDEELAARLGELASVKHYAHLARQVRSLIEEARGHNERVRTLSKDASELVSQHSIKAILEGAPSYSPDKLASFDKTLRAIEGYTIPAEWPLKAAFGEWAASLCELTSDWQAVREQHELVSQFERLVRSIAEGGERFTDRYIDAREAAPFLEGAQAIASRFAAYPTAHYTPPTVDRARAALEDANEAFIARHLGDELFDDVAGRSLDENQRRAVLCDATSNLTVAGAGAGKTLTICAKLLWLLHTGQATADEVLLLSYSRASASDLAAKVEELGLPFYSKPKVKTFHALGLEILNQTSGQRLTVEDQFSAAMRGFFESELQQNPRAAEAVFTFISLYSSPTPSQKHYADKGELYRELKQEDLTTLKDSLSAHRGPRGGGKWHTAKKELVKSYQELAIANWLFTNGVSYEYERAYEIPTATDQRRQYTPDFYLTDCGIYLEHYGVNKEGRTPQYSPQEERDYIEEMAWKRKTHRQCGTVCLETYSWQFSEGTIFESLEAQLAEHGVKLNPLSQEEVLDVLQDVYSGESFRSLMNLLSTFLSLYKARYLDASGFDTLIPAFPTRYENIRAECFLKVARFAYEYYRRHLSTEGKVDFDDMILRSVGALDKTTGWRYKYIIVDEFQDISESRARFLEKLIAHGHSKLFAVGDDWQAIYRFTGCDVRIFLDFATRFAGSRLNVVTATHRNSAELQAVVESFILANPAQLKKHVESVKHQERPVRIVYHDDDKSAALALALDDIAAQNEAARVLLLGRNRRDVAPLLSDEESLLQKGESLASPRHPKMSLSYKTVHQSKGLEADFVILVSCEEGANGFPNKMEDDRLLQLILGQKEAFPFAEERRLFYVALTRTKSVVYVLCDQNRPSSFVKEIESRASVLKAAAIKEESLLRLCPWCTSGKLVPRAADTRFFGCENFPYCKYTINDAAAFKANLRCPDCGDFLVARRGKRGHFLGCHAYPTCRYTRGGSLSEGEGR